MTKTSAISEVGFRVKSRTGQFGAVLVRSELCRLLARFSFSVEYSYVGNSADVWSCWWPLGLTRTTSVFHQIRNSTRIKNRE